MDGTSDNGDKYSIGFGVRFTDVSPGSETQFFRAYDGSSSGGHFLLALETDGDFVLQNAAGTTIATVTAPFVEDRWYYIDILWENLDSADIDVWIDGLSVISLTAQDLNDGGMGAYDTVEFAVGPGGLTHYDDVYMYSGATGTEAILGPLVDIPPTFQNNLEDATDQGSTLTDGSWSNVGHVPNTSAECGYNSSPALAGYTICDEGIRAGPIDFVPGTIKGAKYIARLRRTNGSSPTSLNQRYGNNADGVTDTDRASVLGTSYANFYIVSEAAGVVPTNSEYFAHGIGQVGSGGRDIWAEELWACILHTYQHAATLADINFPPNQPSKLGPFGL
jgi:hypothetical protein